jgi:hypothetical protein
VPEPSAALAARATVEAVERFYTTVEQIRERATLAWRASTLMKEMQFPMTSLRVVALVLPPDSRRGVAENRPGAVFCQARATRLPRSFGFDGCSHPGFLGGLRRFQD